MIEGGLFDIDCISDENDDENGRVENDSEEDKVEFISQLDADVNMRTNDTVLESSFTSQNKLSSRKERMIQMENSISAKEEYSNCYMAYTDNSKNC